MKIEDGSVIRLSAYEQTIREAHFEQFIPGQVMEQTTTDGDVVKKFVPGQVIETLKSGPAFIPGQVVQTDGGLKFVPGEIVVMSNGSALFVPGQVIDSPSGMILKL